MIGIARSLGNFYLYSSLHIAICAYLFTRETYLIEGLPSNDNYLILILLSTLCSYSLHRIVGMRKVKAFNHKGRFKIIAQYKNHIFLYLMLAGLGIMYFMTKFEITHLLLLFPSILITLLYVLPVFKNGRRLRDFPLIKIFLIAFVWSWVCYAIPVLMYDRPINYLLLVERICFIFAITIPFDIRDMDVDKSIKVETLIHKLGVRRSKILALLILFVGFAMLLVLSYLQFISFQYLLGYIIVYVLTAFLITMATKEHHDYYYSGYLDATMGLRLVFLFFLTYLG